MIVTLYSKDGCHLCDEVKEMLEEFSCTINLIDITQDDAIFAQYHYTIPVVIIGYVTLQAPITRAQLRAAFATA